MADEETPPETEQAPVATVPASLVSADGSLVDGWHSQAPEGYEDLREDKSLSTIKNVFALGRSYVHVRKQVPMDKMPCPNENWGDADWEDFHKAGGRPDTAADYGLKRDEGIPEEIMPQEMLDGKQELLFKHGASKKLVEALNSYDNEQMLKLIQQDADKETERNTQLWDSLHSEWGRAYDQKVARGTKAIERGTGGDEGFYERVLGEVNKSADLIKLMANIEDGFSEHDPVAIQRIDTPSDIQSQITELMADPRYNSRDKAVRQPLISKIMRLREQMAKDKQAG